MSQWWAENCRPSVTKLRWFLLYQWLVCSTPHALGPIALNPYTLRRQAVSPRALRPCAISTVGLSEIVLFTKKLWRKSGLLDIIMMLEILFLIDSQIKKSTCNDWFSHVFLSPLGLRAQGLRASGLGAWELEHNFVTTLKPEFSCVF